MDTTVKAYLAVTAMYFGIKAVIEIVNYDSTTEELTPLAMLVLVVAVAAIAVWGGWLLVVR